MEQKRLVNCVGEGYNGGRKHETAGGNVEWEII